MEIEERALDGRLVDLEVGRVNDDAEGRANRERDAVDGRVGDLDELDFEAADFDGLASLDAAEVGLFGELVLAELAADEQLGEGGRVDRRVELGEDVRCR